MLNAMTQSGSGKPVATTRRVASHRLAVVIGLMLATLVLARPASAQLQNLDDATFIAGLEDRGMSELILHFVEIDPPEDPVVRDLISIAQHRIRFRDDSLSREVRREAFNAALDGLSQLIAEHGDHVQSPIWLTDLASLKLIEEMRNYERLAGTYVRFGVPTPEQRDAFSRLSSDAIDAMVRARQKLFDLRGELGRNEELTQRLQLDGTYARLFNEYDELRVPLYFAMASLYVASMPDDSAYFRNLGAEGRADTPEAERRRLIRDAAEAIEPLASPARQTASIARAGLSILGQLRLLSGDPRGAVEPLREARTLRSGGVVDGIVATIALARAQSLLGRLEEGLNLLNELSEDEQVANSSFYLLLLADAKHRLLREDARTLEDPEARSLALGGAYEPYLDLLEDQSLSEEDRIRLRSYIYLRWAANVDGAREATDLPPIVRMGIGEHWLNEARRARSAGQQEKAQDLFRRANTVNETLRGEGLPARVRAKGMYHLGLGKYFSDPDNNAVVVQAARVMLEVAADHPDQPLSEDAIANAVSLTRSLGTRPNPVDAARRTYLDAVKVLLEKYPLTDAADNERVPYAVNVLQSAGSHSQAIEVLEGVPMYSANYFDAQAGILRSLVAMFRAADDAQRREELRERAQFRASRVAEEAREELGEAQGNAALGAWAEARFTIAAAALDRGDAQSAVRQLEGFREDFAREAVLLRRGYEEMISARVAAGELAIAVELAEAMTERFPEESAYVINQVVTRLDREIASLQRQAETELAQSRREDLNEQAQAKADAASRLTNLLLQWARNQNLQPQQLLPYQILHGETLRLAGELEESLEILQPLTEQFPSNGQALFQYGLTQFAAAQANNWTGDGASGQEALRAFGTLSRPNLYTRPFPDMYWLSNLRLVQLMDMRAKGQKNTDIFLRIRRLEQIDDNLGGSATKAMFEQLKARHAP
jgi:hypothetical protein